MTALPAWDEAPRHRFRERQPLTFGEMLALLDEVVARLSTTGRRGGSTGFASQPPIALTALEIRERFMARWDELEVWDDVERFLDGRLKMPAGDCWRCSFAVLAYPDETVIDCPFCLAVVDVQQNRRLAIDLAMQRRLTAAQIERESPRYGVTIRASRVRTWAWRSRIVADEQGRYSLADVLRLADGA